MRELYRKSPQEVIKSEVRVLSIAVFIFFVVLSGLTSIRSHGDNKFSFDFESIVAVTGLIGIYALFKYLDIGVAYLRGLKNEKYTVQQRFIRVAGKNPGHWVKFLGLNISLGITKEVYGQLTIGDQCCLKYFKGIFGFYLVELTTDTNDVAENFDNLELNEEMYTNDRGYFVIKFKFLPHFSGIRIEKFIESCFFNSGYSKIADNCYERGEITNTSIDNINKWLIKVTVSMENLRYFQNYTIVDYHICIGKTPITRDVIDFWNNEKRGLLRAVTELQKTHTR